MTNTQTTLAAPGPRARVSVEEAREIKTQWETQLAENRDDSIVITTLDMSCRAWPLETLKVLEPVLKRIAPTVRILKLDDIMASLLTEEGLDCLSFFDGIFSYSQAPHVTHVYLYDNALGTRGLDSLQHLIGHSLELQHLSFNNCGMSKEVVLRLCDMLQERAPHLVGLSMSRNQIGPAGAIRLAELLPLAKDLRRFEYAGSRAGRPGTLALAQGLSNMVQNGNEGMQEIDMDDCVFGNGEDDQDPIHSLCAVLQKSPKLTKLVVKDGSLEASGLAAVLDALQTSGAQLTYLDVGANDIEEDGVTALTSYIQNCQATLQELHLECNSLGEDCGEEALPTLLETLSECPNLRVLNVNDNEFSGESFQALLDTKIPSLQILHCKENNHDDEENVNADVVEQLRDFYPSVILDDDDEEAAGAAAATVPALPDEQVDEQVDELAQALGATQI